MKQVLIQGGRAVVREMPVPSCGPGEVLVHAAYSLVSAGTEGRTLVDSGRPAPGRFVQRVKKIGEVVRMAVRRGPGITARTVRDRLEGPCLTTGYSLAGTVVEVGRDVRDLSPGQRVACAGAASAHHAEFVAVPRNLVVAVPEGLPLERAACVTLGAIALQGVRQADPRLGEIACVIGLGLVGRLTAALLGAAGCRVIGSDLDGGRVAAAEAWLERGVVSGDEALAQAVNEATGGHGADVVLLTASTPSSGPVREAFELVRRRGRVVVVGDVGLDLDRVPFYMKEAELRISTSYGPGRYDADYEERGHDYPYGYVRWTENRNMQEFLRLVGAGHVDLDALEPLELPVERAAEAYARLGDDPPPLAVLLSYPGAEGPAPEAADRRVELVEPPRRAGLRIALVGPGSFASAVHLPNLEALEPTASLRTVVARTASAAREPARRWSAAHAATDLSAVLEDDDVDAVMICTRHDLHAEQAIRALDAGKAVFLEKPAALDDDELRRLRDAIERSGRPFTLGFNRRFAPDVLAVEERLADRRGPLVLGYRVHADRLPRDHWALGPEGGGRLIGEACHMLDLMRHLVGAAVDRMQIAAARSALRGEDFIVTVEYADGSLGALTYTASGRTDDGKERLELCWDGHSARIDDFRQLTVDGVAGEPRERPNKGHAELLRRFVDHARGAGPAPIPLDEIFEVSRRTLELDARLRRGND